MGRIRSCASIALVGTFYTNGCAIVIIPKVTWTVCIIESSERINGARCASCGGILTSFAVIMTKLTYIEKIRISPIVAVTFVCDESSIRITRSAVIRINRAVLTGRYASCARLGVNFIIMSHAETEISAGKTVISCWIATCTVSRYCRTSKTRVMATVTKQSIIVLKIPLNTCAWFRSCPYNLPYIKFKLP